MPEDPTNLPSVQSANTVAPTAPNQIVAFTSTPVNAPSLKLANIFIYINAAVSLIAAAGILGLIIMAEMALASIGYPGLVLLLLPVPIVLAVDGAVLLLNRKRTAALFTYYTIVRILAIVGLTRYAYDDSSKLGSGAWVPLSIIAFSILVIASGLIFFRQNRSWIKLVPLLIWAVGGIAICIFVVLTFTGTIRTDLSAQKADELISYDLDLLRQDIGFNSKDGKPPTGTAKELAARGEYGRQFKIAERAGAYTYEPLPESNQFKLCATFASDNPDLAAFDSEYAEGNTSYYKKGYQCFKFDMSPVLPG